MIVAMMAWRFSLYMLGQPEVRLYNGFDTHSSGLLFGAAAAYIMAMPDIPWRIRLAQEVAKCLPFLTAAVVLMLLFADSRHPAMYLSGNSFAAFVTVLAIFAISEGECGWLRRLLEWRPLVETGRISYGLYIWHYVIFSIMFRDFGFDWWVVNTAGITFSLAAALLSYQLIERPALTLKTRIAAA